jgi:thiosulfate dehydrogenase [quinone] large subunit
VPAQLHPSASTPSARYDAALLPLRLFLGVTYCFAGLQKLANPSYLSRSAPAGVFAQMQGASHDSPIGGLLGGTAHHYVLFGLLIAFGELAVGIGTLLGLFARLAAVGGMALALSFLLAVSWHSSPYYLGRDIVFLMAFTPLAIVGAGHWSADRLLRDRARGPVDPADVGPVPVDFKVVRRLCRAYEHGGCRIRQDHVCMPEGCPVLVASDRVHHEEPVDLRRRQLLETTRVAAGVAAIGLFGGGAAAAIGRLFHQDAPASHALGTLHVSGGGSQKRPTPTTGASTTTTRAPGTSAPPSSSATSTSEAPATTAPTTTEPVPAGTAIGNASDVPVGAAALFSDPATGTRSIIVQPSAGVFQACSAVCTHQGCTVGYDTGAGVLRCPCHGAEFDPSTGSVVRGPARQPLATITIRKGSDGTLYADG